MSKLRVIAGLIKVEHTLFSLPLLFAGALLSKPWTGWEQLDGGRLGLIVLAGIGARAAALAINRILDRAIDARNPRTQSRELPSGALSQAGAWAVVAVGSLVYLWAAWRLGPLCLQLAPIPLLVFVLYPLMKRFTWACHFGVGLGLALAPLGGAVGYAQTLALPEPLWWLAGFTFCWVSGFDVLYATLDEDFDRREGLHSIPAVFGRSTAHDVGAMLHGAAGLCLAAIAHQQFFPLHGWLTWAALAPAGILLALEQRFGYSLEPGSPFFQINAWIGVAAAAFIGFGVLG